MGEYLRDELARTCKTKRPKFLGFGNDQTPYAGVPVTGVVRSQTVQYDGAGIFNVMGVFVIGWNATWAPVNAGLQTFAWSILDGNRRYILQDCLEVQASFNQIYDNLDHGFVMTPTDYYFVETKNLGATRTFGGFLWGDEYLF